MLCPFCCLKPLTSNIFSGFFTLLKPLLYRDLSQREQFSRKVLGKVSGVRCQCSAGSELEVGWFPPRRSSSDNKALSLSTCRINLAMARTIRPTDEFRQKTFSFFEFLPLTSDLQPLTAKRNALCVKRPGDHFPLYSRCRRDKRQRRNRSQYTSRHQPPFPVRFPLPLVWR